MYDASVLIQPYEDEIVELTQSLMDFTVLQMSMFAQFAIETEENEYIGLSVRWIALDKVWKAVFTVEDRNKLVNHVAFGSCAVEAVAYVAKGLELTHHPLDGLFVDLDGSDTIIYKGFHSAKESKDTERPF